MAELSPQTNNNTISRFILRLSLLALGLIALALLSVWILFKPQIPLPFFSASRSVPPPGAKSSGPAAPLPTMLALARQEADKIDRAAEFTSMTGASPGYIYGVPYSSPITGSLEFVFTFYRPIGNSINIWMEDTAPAATLSIDTSDAESSIGRVNYENARKGRQEKERLYNSMKLTPRDAIERTWEEAHRYAEEQGLSNQQYQLVVYADHLDGIPGKWTIQYKIIGPEASPSPGTVLNVLDSAVIEFKVNGQNGQILERRFDRHQVIPTTLP